MRFFLHKSVSLKRRRKKVKPHLGMHIENVMQIFEGIVVSYIFEHIITYIFLYIIFPKVYFKELKQECFQAVIEIVFFSFSNVAKKAVFLQ